MIQAMSCYFDSKAVLRESICYIQGVTPKKQIAGVIWTEMCFVLKSLFLILHKLSILPSKLLGEQQEKAERRY